MIQSRRRRRYAQSFAPERKKFALGKVIGIVVLIGIAVVSMWKLASVFSPVTTGQRVATSLQTEGRGRTEVLINGEGTPQRAESGLRLYEGDTILTDSSATAVLTFFDDTVVTLDGDTTLVLGDVLKGEEQSTMEMSLTKGRLWISTGADSAVARSITTNRGELVVPAHTKMIMSSDPSLQDDLYVFDSSGPGVEFQLHGSSLTIGEGQELHLSSTHLAQIQEGILDPYETRRALDSGILSSDFYVQNAEREGSAMVLAGNEEEKPAEESAEVTVDGELLVVDAPEDGKLLTGNAVNVVGRVGSRVTLVRVNGYAAELTDGSFTKEIALPDEEDFSIEVQAEDRDGLLVAEKSLLVHRDIQPPEPPTITEPAVEGSVVQVNADDFEIIGNAGSDTAGIMVNGYRLQKYVPGKPWHYLVDPKIGNVTIGENIYEVIALDRAGNQSEPVEITIVWKAQPLPNPENPPSPDDGNYLEPGSLHVIAPTSGTTYTTSEDEVLIEGETHPDTFSISVNGYGLSLYLPGKTTWNYIAKADFGNYKEGVNRYTIVARNSDGKILDVLQYMIEKQ